MNSNFNLILICIFGLYVQNVFSWTDTKRLSEIDKVELSNIAPYMGGYRHQLNCLGEKELCSHIQDYKNYVHCYNKGMTEKKEVIWDCPYYNYDIPSAKLKIVSLTYESPKDKKFDDEVYIYSFVLNYTLEYESIRLKDVERLNLKIGYNTTGHKIFPELNCKNNLALCKLYRAKEVNCTNLGIIDGNVRWECKSNFPSFIEFDQMDVSCEKKKSSDFDDEIIKDSCALFYSLKLKTQKLNEIGQINFKVNHITGGSQPITQLQCLRSKTFRNLCELYPNDEITCNFIGIKNDDFEWQCEKPANLPSNVKFLIDDLSCERPDKPESPLEIVRESCGLRYTLKQIFS